MRQPRDPMRKTIAEAVRRAGIAATSASSPAGGEAAHANEIGRADPATGVLQVYGLLDVTAFGNDASGTGGFILAP